MNPRRQPWQGCTLPLSYSRLGVYKTWRRHPDLNRRSGFCRPMPYRLAMPPLLERETGFEPATSTLARLHSTAELLPLNEDEFYGTHPRLSTYFYIKYNKGNYFINIIYFQCLIFLKHMLGS